MDRGVPCFLVRPGTAHAGARLSAALAHPRPGYRSLGHTLNRWSHVEFDALRERQLRTPIDRRGLAPHVRFPGVRAGLAAAAGVLLAAEGAADLSAGGSEIDVGNTAVAAIGGKELLGDLQAVGEYR